MKRLQFALILCFGLGAGELSAQPREMFPWWETPIVRDLNLSEEQMRQIQSIVKENRDKLVDLRAAVEKADHAVNDLMNDDRPDLAKFSASIDRQSAARAELTKGFSLMGFRIRMVLNPQQWRELQRRRDQDRLRLDPNRPGVKKGLQQQGRPPLDPQQGRPRIPQGPPLQQPDDYEPPV
ncbi:MAG: periplasmic heavy metal sensor [Acidobacteria bacterium]|nr:periplasmic heavy metal sensor [Acidobacteriota bacterium]